MVKDNASVHAREATQQCFKEKILMNWKIDKLLA